MTPEQMEWNHSTGRVVKVQKCAKIMTMVLTFGEEIARVTIRRVKKPWKKSKKFMMYWHVNGI